MKIGITERGDAGIDFSWQDRLSSIDGVVLITKILTAKFINAVLEAYRNGHKIIVHCTCTGWGSSIIKPNAPSYKIQLDMLKSLVKSGFPLKQCVLRIDPIFPTENGIKRVTEVLEYAYDLALLPQMRIRISILDEYRHVKQCFRKLGFSPVYGDDFQAPESMIQNLIRTLNRYDLQFECCAEKFLVNQNQFVHLGCISERDLHIMGLKNDKEGINPQNRNGCNCLSRKTELLTYKARCSLQCAYCYWKD